MSQELPQSLSESRVIRLARASGGDQGVASKLARLLYRMLRYGMKYVNQGAEFYEAQHRKQQVIHLKRKAAQLGLEIIDVTAAA